MATLPTMPVEVYASYTPRHRRDLSPLLVKMLDVVHGHATAVEYEPRHRADVAVTE